MGPAAAPLQWTAAALKWKSRTVAVAATRSSAAVSASLYTSRCLPVLGYLAQLLPLPKGFTRNEKVALHHILHMATNSLDAATPFNLREIGGPKIGSARVLAAASVTRALLKTLPGWQQKKLDLQISAEEFLPVGRWSKGVLSASCWDSEAMASYLDQAYRCFPGDTAMQTRSTGGTRSNPCCYPATQRKIGQTSYP